MMNAGIAVRQRRKKFSGDFTPEKNPPADLCPKDDPIDLWLNQPHHHQCDECSEQRKVTDAFDGVGLAVVQVIHYG